MLIIFSGFIYISCEMSRPIPFISKKELDIYSKYKKTAFKLHQLNEIKLNRDKFATRRDLINFLKSESVFTNNEIHILAGKDCIESEKLYDKGIVFWASTKHAVFFVNENWSSSIMARKDFERKFSF
jgi:hypothetical protein